MVIGMLVTERKSSPVTFCVLPGLMVPTLNLLGSARAASSASFSVCHGESAFTSSSRSNSASVDTGVNAVTGSNGMVFSSDFDSAMPLENTKRVYPSGCAEVTALAAMMPPALGRFSITTWTPARSLSCWPTSRMVMSAKPPGPNGMTTRIGRLG